MEIGLNWTKLESLLPLSLNFALKGHESVQNDNKSQFSAKNVLFLVVLTKKHRKWA